MILILLPIILKNICVRHLYFIDSFQFMSQSLDNLPSNLPEDRFIYTKEEIDGDLELMTKKLLL